MGKLDSAGDSEKISSRVRVVIKENLSVPKLTKLLEDDSGIASDTWRKFLSGHQKSTPAIIEYVCVKFPSYALYIATGFCDSECGHIAPRGVEATELCRGIIPAVVSLSVPKSSLANDLTSAINNNVAEQ
jgi:hypothetical protein